MSSLVAPGFSARPCFGPGGVLFAELEARGIASGMSTSTSTSTSGEAAVSERAAQQSVEADGRASWLESTRCLSPVQVARARSSGPVTAFCFWMRPQLNSGTLGGQREGGEMEKWSRFQF